MKTIITLTAAGIFAAGMASASTVPNDASGGPHLFDAVNAVTGSTHTDNDDIESIRIVQDEIFSLIDTGTPLIGLSNGFTNDLGWYSDGDSGNVTLSNDSYTGFGLTGAGTVGDPFAGGYLLGNPLNSNPIGFALETNGNGGNTYYSQASLNADGMDHMVAYQLGALELHFYTGTEGEADYAVHKATYENAILIGWEDIFGGGDMDFNDGMFIVDATPVPVPAAGLLLMGGLGGLAALRRRKKS